MPSLFPETILAGLPETARLALEHSSMEGSSLWTILVPIAINLAVFAYYFGSLAARIRVLEQDFDKMRDTSARVDTKVHDLAIIMAKVETKMDDFFLQVKEHLDCPLKGDRRRARRETREQE